MKNDNKIADAEALERYESAMIDADIAGLARDPEVEAMVAEWRAEGIDAETRIEMLKDHYRGHHHG